MLTGIIVLVMMEPVPGDQVPGQPGYAWPVEIQVGRFEVHAEFPLRDRAAVTALETLPGELQAMLAIAPRATPIHVFVLRNQATFERYLHHLLPGVAMRPAFFAQKGEMAMVFAYDRPELVQDLRHECTHALLHRSVGPLPLWLDEGLAEYFEHTVPQPGNSAEPFPLADLPDSKVCRELENLTDLNQMTERHYAQSRAWVHYLLHHSATTRAQLQAWLRSPSSTTDPGHGPAGTGRGTNGHTKATWPVRGDVAGRN